MARVSGWENPHIHVGVGKLAVGAVIPFIRLQLPNRQLLLVQSESERWNGIAKRSICRLQNDANFKETFDIWRPVDKSDLKKRINKRRADDQDISGIIIITEDDTYVAELVKILNSSLTSVSCSVGSGQKRVALALSSKNAKWSRIYAFENRLDPCWDEVSFLQRIHHVVVDRICSDLMPMDDAQGKSVPVMNCICEKKFASFLWPDQCKEFSDRDDRKRETYGFNSDNSFRAVKNIGFYAKKKRALVNGPHMLFAIFCSKILKENNFELENQYFGPLYALLKEKYSEWNGALDTYIRMRSIEMALDPSVQIDPAELGQYFVAFLENYQEAKLAIERFVNTTDTIKRLIGGVDITAKGEKFSEHVTEPFEYYKDNRIKIERLFGFEAPDWAEVFFLEDFLDKIWNEILGWIDSQQKTIPQRIKK